MIRWREIKRSYMLLKVKAVDKFQKCRVDTLLNIKNNLLPVSHTIPLQFYIRCDGCNCQFCYFTQLDDHICQEVEMYGYSRVQGSIAAPDIHLVQPDTFQALREFIIDTTDASVNQFKVPRVLRLPSAVEFMMNRVLKKE